MSLPEGFEVVSTPSAKPLKQSALPAGFEVVSTPVHKKNLLETTDFTQKPQYSLPQNSSDDAHSSSNKVKIEVKKGKVATTPIVNKSALSDEDLGVVPTIKEAGRIVGYNLAKHGAAFNNLIGDKEQEALRRKEMKEFEESSSILSSDSEATKMVAKMGLDPLTYTPVGIFNKGKKAWDVAKSALAGGAIGAGLTAEDQLGTTGKVDMKSIGFGAGLGASINALLSTFTHGKVHGAIPENEADTIVTDVPKAHAPQHDEEIASAMNKEYAPAHADVPKAPAENPPADFVDDIDVGHKAQEVDPKIAEAKAAQEERVRLAHEEAMERKAQSEAQKAHKADVETISSHPRLQELIDMRRDVSAKDSARPNIRTTDRQIIHENNGSGYETTVIPAMDSKNYNHDFALTQADIKAYEKNGITPALAEKFKKDLDVLDNDPVWAKVDEKPLDDFAVDKDGNPIDADGNQLFVRGADNVAVGMIAGIDEDENGNITFDPEKFVIGLGGYTAVKALAKNPTVQKELREYAQRALNELDAKPHGQYLTGEIPLFAGEKAKGFDQAKKAGDVHYGKYDDMARFEIDDSVAKLKPINRLSKEEASRIATDQFAKIDADLASGNISKEIADFEKDQAYANYKFHEQRTYMLDDVIDHPQLFDNYPQFKNTKVEFLDDADGAKGYYDPETNTIGIENSSSEKDILSTLLHETQHNIQGVEGFARGGNMEEAVRELDKRIYHLENEGFLDNHLAEKYASEIDKLRNNKVYEAFKIYERIAGEVEAREVQARQLLTPDERSVIQPYENGTTLTNKQYEYANEIENYKNIQEWQAYQKGEVPFDNLNFNDMEELMGKPRLNPAQYEAKMRLNESRDPTYGLNHEQLQSKINIAKATMNGLYEDSRVAYKARDEGRLTNHRSTDIHPKETLVRYDNVTSLSQDKPKEPFYSVAQKAIDAMPNKMDTEAFVKYLKNNGVKDDEILHSGIAKAIEGKTSITKDEIIGVFSNPVMEKKVLGEVKSPLVKEYDDLYELISENPTKYPRGSDEYIRWEELSKQLDPEQIGKEYDGSTKYQDYSLKGVGDNYREELVTLKGDNDVEWKDKLSPKQMEDGTWNLWDTKGEAGWVYHKGFKTKDDLINESAHDDMLIKSDKATYRSSHWDEPNVLLHTRKQDTVIDGDKTLLVEEIQSDWHQDGRKKGYTDKLTPSEDKEYKKLLEESLDFTAEFSSSQSKRMYDLEAKLKPKITQAPMSKTWHEYGIRQIIDEAVAKGYDRVAWVDGATQAQRYAMSHSVDRVVYNKQAGVIQGFKDGQEVMYKSADESELEHLIGKEPAKRLIENEVHSGIHEIKGEALDIGGDGMKGFYDKILVDYAKKYTKKWGTTVEKKALPNGTEVHTFPVTQKMREDVSKNGQALYANGIGSMAGIETDENGNIVGFDPVKALVGVAGGSILLSKSVRNQVSKLVGKTEHLSDSAIQGLVRTAIKTADIATAGSLTKIANTLKESAVVDYVIGHKIYKLKDYMKLREDALRSSNAGMEQAARLHLQLSELSSEAREAMYAYMGGEKNVALTPELKKAADTFITKIDDMGQKMVDEGFLSKEAYEEWQGQYLHRRYASKIKQASDWASGKGEFAVDKVQMRGKQWKGTADEFDELQASGSIGKVSEGKVEATKISDGSYHFRRDWSKEERASMGEIRDIAYSLPETVGRLAQMTEFGKMLKAVPKKYLLDQGSRSDVVMRQLGYEKLTGSRYGALNGQWVNSSIAGDLKRVSNDVLGEEHNVKKLWNDYVSAVKMTHTIYNPTAHVNNIGSNIFLQGAAGLNPLKAIKYATDGTLASRRYGRWKELDAKRVTGLGADESAELAKIEADSDVQLWKSLDERKMFGRSQLNEILRTYMSPSIDTKAGSMVHKASEAAKALYQGEDDVMRFAAVKQLTKDGIWTQETTGMTQKVMNIDEAMKHANDHIIPDYSKPMSKLALTLRDTGVVPFMSWTYYSTPILLSQLRNNPTRVMAIAAAWYGMDRLMGVDPYNDETMPKGFDAQRVAIARDGNKVTGMRVSSMIPHVQLTDPENTYLEPLTSGIPQTILGAATNYNFYFRKPITMKEGGEGAYQRAKYAVQNVLPTPDVLDKAYNIVESKVLDKETRRTDRVIEPRTTAQEAASFFVNLQTYDVSKQREKVRKDKIRDKKTSDKWDKKVDKAMNKLQRVFQ